MLKARPHDLAESTGQISHSTCNILYDLNSQNNRNTHLYSQLTMINDSNHEIILLFNSNLYFYFIAYLKYF